MIFHVPHHAHKTTLKDRSKLFACSMAGFLATPAAFFWSPVFRELTGVRTWFAMVLLGAVTLWPLLFRRSALLTVFTASGIMLATVIVSGGCKFFFSSPWCANSGQLWLFILSMCSLYCVSVIYAVRRKLKQETWKEALMLGIVPYVSFFLLFPFLISLTSNDLLMSSSPLGTALRTMVLYIIPFLLLSWLVIRMMEEKRGKSVKTVLAY